jgi:hypothetical protein
MLRTMLIAAAAFAACASAVAEEQAVLVEQSAAEEQFLEVRRDGFVISGDECGASRYSSLLGEDYAELYQASLVPGDSNVVNHATLRTLEYEPGQLNIVLDGGGRIIAIGCF